MVLVQFRISVFAFIELILTSPCFSKRLHHCMILWPLDHASVLALVVHIAFGTKDKDILGNEKMSITLISRKKKKKESHGRESRVQLGQFHPEACLCFKATFHSLVYTYHLCSHIHTLFCSFIPLSTYWAQSLLGSGIKWYENKDIFPALQIAHNLGVRDSAMNDNCK